MVDWGQCDPESVSDYLASFRRCCDSLTDTVNTLKSGIVLRRVDPAIEAEAQAAIARSKTTGRMNDLSPEISRHYIEVLRDWCGMVER
jgi:hypothetical protein